jgi:hypothetical protein
VRDEDWADSFLPTITLFYSVILEPQLRPSQHTMALDSASWPRRHRLALSFVIGCIQCFFVIPYVADGFSTQKLIPRERNLDQGNSPLRLQVEAQPSSTDISSDESHIIFPGGGIFFYWQAGVVSYLREEGYDLSSCSFSGASAGALTATLATAEVDFYEATDLALKLAADAGVWDRSLGLQGIWGPMIEEWLDTLLPASIEGIEGRLSLLVTPVPSFGKTKISTFIDKKDLIECNMASIHLVRIRKGLLQFLLYHDTHKESSTTRSHGFWMES